MSGSGGKLAQKILPAVIVAPVLTVLFFWTILLRRPWGGYDWRHFYHYYDWVRVSLTEHHTLPLYMPNALHTTDFLANPVSPLLGPLVWLLFLIPTGAYIKLLIAFYATAGLLGMFALLRDQGVNPETALFGSVVFAFNGFFLSHFAMGHYCFFALYLLPTLLFLFRRALLGSRGALWLAAVVNVVVASLGLQRLVDRARSRPTAHRLLRGLMLVLALLVGLDLHWQSRVWQNVGPGVFPPHRDHVPVVRMLRAREGDTARVTQFTPHRFVVTAKSIRGGSLLLPREPISGRDQWRVSGGRITSVRERLAVTVPPGESIITFTYVARYFRLGLTITAITLVAAAISLSRGRLRARTEAGGPREGFVRSRWKATRHE